MGVFVGGDGGGAAVGFVIAYGMGELFLFVANSIFGDEVVVPATNALIHDWTPASFPDLHKSDNTILTKLMQDCDAGRVMTHLHREDLVMLEDLSVKDSEIHESGCCSDPATDRDGGEDSVDSVGVIQRVYLPDLDIVLNLVSGKVENVGAKAAYSKRTVVPEKGMVT
eukprot:TRINITY_DN51723_c0_g1_i1.p2 TRINITY_DN51723_c0_g1~~TRINITY_DN51723_c0_g1_i1.p2  ORF type:complete len:168 (-),score=18.23 TRINITY_DN51723_c0_g1_i1:277-780(-)